MEETLNGNGAAGVAARIAASDHKDRVHLDDAALDVMVIDRDHVQHLWPIIEPFIALGLAEAYDGYTADQCRQRLIGTPGVQPDLIAVVLIAPGATEPAFVLTLEMYDNPVLGRICHGFTAGGAGLDAWRDELYPVIEYVAREQGADYITTKGRKGWERALAPLGFEHLYTVLGKKVTT